MEGQVAGSVLRLISTSSEESRENKTRQQAKNPTCLFAPDPHRRHLRRITAHRGIFPIRPHLAADQGSFRKHEPDLDGLPAEYR